MPDDIDPTEKIRMEQQMEQAQAWLADRVPPMLFAFYRNCVEAGFTIDQAMILTLENFRSMRGK